MTTIDAKHLRELHAKATPGPWRHYDPSETDGSVMLANVGLGYDGEFPNGDDGRLIVAMRNQLPALLDRLDRLEAVAKAAHAVVGAHAKRYTEERRALVAALASLKAP